MKMERADRLAVIQLDPARNRDLTGQRILDLNGFVANDHAGRAVELAQIENHRAIPPVRLAGGMTDVSQESKTLGSSERNFKLFFGRLGAVRTVYSIVLQALTVHGPDRPG